MEIELLIQKKKEIYCSLIDFIDNTENADFESLINIFEIHSIIKDKEEIISTLQLLSKISDNHHRLPDFIDKLSKIIQYLIQDKKSQISDSEIYKIFKNNKRILLMLFEQKFIQPDEKIIKDIMTTKDNYSFPYHHYLYSGIKSFIDENKSKMIESKIKQKYEEEITQFEEKCHIGENDSYICSLIRQDSVEEFISYVNRTNTPLSIQIQPSIFETNLFLMQKRPTLIEYATFFGSIQIIQYLKYNKVSLTNSLWLYVIHSNNAELIHFLEENEIELQRNDKNKTSNTFHQNKKCLTYDEIFKESIACHHNTFADYIKDNFLDTTQLDNFSLCIINNCNYYYYPTDIESIICKSNNEYGFNISQICFSLTQITIPSSVTSIGKYSFFKCSSLTEITIPSSVTSIEDLAFDQCSSLTKIIIPSSVTSIGFGSFYSCSSLTQITIPSSVTSIENCAFELCSSLTQIAILSSITSIRESSFKECSSLTQIIIPSSVTSIEESAFSGCSSLTQIAIPSSVTSIGKSAFSGCSLLTQITIPSSVTSIGNSAFSKCTSLTQITFEIPSSLTSIGDCAFRECSSLTQITFPSSVTSIGNDVFSGCSSLKITIFPSVTSIGNSAFSVCSSLTQFTIPSSVTSIGNSAFYRCSSLTQITIPSSVTSIGNYAFSECSSLTQITIPSSITKIGFNAFKGCSSLPPDIIQTINNIVLNINNNNNNNINKTQLSSNDHRNKSKKLQCRGYDDKRENNRSHFDRNNTQQLMNINNNSTNRNKTPITRNGNINLSIRSRLNRNKDSAQSILQSNNNSKISNNNIQIYFQKSQNLSGSRHQNTSIITNEIEIMRILNHPNVLKIQDISYNDEKLPTISYEECSTNLKQSIQTLSNVQRVYSIYQIAEGMKYIHSCKIMHVNLNPSSIFISDEGIIKISDFKNAQKMSSENQIGEMDDVYSFGELVYFILNRSEINQSEKETVLKSFTLLAQQLIESCFDDDLENRTTFEIILEVLEQNKFKLIPFTQQEFEDISKLIGQYKKQILRCAE